MDKTTILNLIHKFIAQRSGIDWRNYVSSGSDTAGRDALRADYTRILKHGRDARALLSAVERSSITGETIIERLRTGGRLSLDGERLEYTTGQYFPTEYRAAVCNLLASLLLDHYGHDDTATDGLRPLVRARNWAKRNLGRGIADRWFT